MEAAKLNRNLITEEAGEQRIVNLFSPMEKTEANAVNIARSAADKTVIMAEEKLGVRVDYVTYTAEDYQDKTYDRQRPFLRYFFSCSFSIPLFILR